MCALKGVYPAGDTKRQFARPSRATLVLIMMMMIMRRGMMMMVMMVMMTQPQQMSKQKRYLTQLFQMSECTHEKTIPAAVIS